MPGHAGKPSTIGLSEEKFVDVPNPRIQPHAAREWRRLLEVVKGQESSPDFAIEQRSSGAQSEVLADFLGTDTIEGTA